MGRYSYIPIAVQRNKLIWDPITGQEMGFAFEYLSQIYICDVIPYLLCIKLSSCFLPMTFPFLLGFVPPFFRSSTLPCCFNLLTSSAIFCWAASISNLWAARSRAVVAFHLCFSRFFFFKCISQQQDYHALSCY